MFFSFANNRLSHHEEKNTTKRCNYYKLCHAEGGSGKSTMTHLIALALSGVNLKHKVLVIDADEQKSLTINYARVTKKGAKEVYDLVTKGLNDIRDYVRTVLSDYDYILIDIPGTFMAEGVRKTFLLADYVFVPVKPSAADFDSFHSVEKLLRDVKAQKDKHDASFEYYFYISIADAKTTSTKNLIEYFEKSKHPVLTSAQDEDKMAIFYKYEKYTYDYTEPINIVEKGMEKSDLSFRSFFESVYKIIK